MTATGEGSTTRRLVLLRHGQSTWNHDNRFTGWADPDLTARGEDEALRAGQLLSDAGIQPDVVHTSLQTRAIRTSDLTLGAMDRLWIPVRRHWRLNERHYGDLTGHNKNEILRQVGEEQFMAWRRGYRSPPPPIGTDNADNPNLDLRYQSVPTELLPLSECLHDVLVRLLPYWYDRIIADLRPGGTVLVAAHGNSLRALCKHLDQIVDESIVDLDLPTGTPLIYDLDDSAHPLTTTATLNRLLSTPAEPALISP